MQHKPKDLRDGGERQSSEARHFLSAITKATGSGQAVDRQEWTHEKLQGLLGISNEDRYVADHAFETTLDEINATLADEREKWSHSESQRNQELTAEERERAVNIALSAQAAIVAEPELPSNMPEQMWKAVQNDKDAAVELLRIVVRLTKQGIIERLGNPNLLNQHDADTIAPYIKIIEDAKEIIERYNDGDERPAVAALSDIEAILWGNTDAERA